MGNRLMSADTKVFGRKPRRFRQSFTLDAANPPVALFPTTIAAAGFARAERMAAGRYEFELADQWALAQLEAGATWGNGQDTVDLYPQVSVALNASGKPIITIRLKTGAANTDAPASPNGGVLNVWWECEAAP